MLSRIFDRNKNTPTVPHQLYGTVVAQARLPVFFTDYQFPDTVMGRFDVLILHVFLLCHRLGLEGQAKADNLSQEVFDCFVENLETALRELGIGDSSVPKKKKKLVRSFYGVVEDFNESLKSRDLALLADAINKRFYDNGNTEISAQLAKYCCAASDQLMQSKIKLFYQGELSWINVPQVQS
ncbi:MAG: ubiquinol-cytochrome C chaperone [Hyphomicrobiales bacterium]|nr:MAG: ubiquinol-cytochrome C chaperone [Hyphomicrobiales bacterium]